MDTIMYLHGKQCIIKYFKYLNYFQTIKRSEKSTFNLEDVKLETCYISKSTNILKDVKVQ